MEAFSRRDGQLFAEGVALSAIAERFGTPTYVYSRAHIEAQYRAYADALSGIPHLVCFAVKANSNLGVLNVLARLGAGFDIVSGGEQQRVLIARTLLQLWPSLNPTGRVLLLDEPLAGLDLHHQMALLRLLKQLAAQGLLVVVAIHDINLAIDWADRVLCLQQGRVVGEGDVGIIDEALLERVFQIRTDRIEAAGRTWFMPSL